ncbi:hypothetical protein DOY81_010667, partial [Sarcophaga bullata]
IDIASALDALCPVASSIMSFIKMFFVWWYRAEFRSLIGKVRHLTQAQNTIGKTRMRNILRLQLTNAVLNARLVSIFRFPETLMSMPWYPLTYILVHWHGYITVLAFVGADGFFLAFCIYFATLLKAIQQDLLITLSDTTDKLNSFYDSEEKVYLALENIIKRHNEIAELIDKFSLIMVEITLSQFITSSIIIATSVVDLLLVSCIAYSMVILLIMPPVFEVLWLWRHSICGLYLCRFNRNLFSIVWGNTVMERHLFFNTAFCFRLIGFYPETERTLKVQLWSLFISSFWFTAIYAEFYYGIHYLSIDIASALDCLMPVASSIMSSEDLAVQAYSSQWYTHSVRIQKMVLLIMVRSQKTIVIKVPFFAPSLPALTAILRFTGSVIALAKSVI